MSLRPSLASPRARNNRTKPSQSRPFFQVPQPPNQKRSNFDKINPSKRTRLIQVRNNGVDLDAILASAKSGNIARPAMPAGQFAWDMSSPVADQRRILRDKEIEQDRLEATDKPNSNNPLSPRTQRGATEAVQTTRRETASEQLFSCSPMPSPQNSPRQSTLKASPVRTMTIDFNFENSLNISGLNLEDGSPALNGPPSPQTPQSRRATQSSPSPHSPQSPPSPRLLVQNPNAKNGGQPSLEPAVMVAYVRDQNTFGSPPRRVAVERKRVEYGKQSITGLLVAAGVDVNTMVEDIARRNDEALPSSSLQNQVQFNTTISSPSRQRQREMEAPTYASQGGLSKNLPLDIFDNMDFEMYTPEEWMRRVRLFLFVFLFFFFSRGVADVLFFVFSCFFVFFQGMNEDSGAVEIPARSLLPATGSATWHACTVTAYDK